MCVYLLWDRVLFHVAETDGARSQIVVSSMNLLIYER